MASKAQEILYGKCMEGSSHYLGDKQDFDVLSDGPSSGITFRHSHLQVSVAIS